MAAEYALGLGMCRYVAPRPTTNNDSPPSHDIHGDFETPCCVTFAAPICDSTREARYS